MSGSQIGEQVRELVEPRLAPAGFEVVDVEIAARVLRISVDRPGGIDLDGVSEATHLVSSALDDHDSELGDLATDRYVLEVSSPGIERPLRTPEHFQRFVGHPVTVRTLPGTEGERRVEGTLEAAGDEGIVVGGRAIAYADVERARTRFVWPEPQQTKGKAGVRR